MIAGVATTDFSTAVGAGAADGASSIPCHSLRRSAGAGLAAGLAPGGLAPGTGGLAPGLVLFLPGGGLAVPGALAVPFLPGAGLAAPASLAVLSSGAAGSVRAGGEGGVVTRHALGAPEFAPPPPSIWHMPQAWQSQLGQCAPTCLLAHHVAHFVIFLGSLGHPLGATEGLSVGEPHLAPAFPCGRYTRSGGRAGGPGGLQRAHSAQSQFEQWSAACLALHHGAHVERSQVGTTRGLVGEVSGMTGMMQGRRALRTQNRFPTCAARL